MFDLIIFFVFQTGGSHLAKIRLAFYFSLHFHLDVATFLIVTHISSPLRLLDVP